MIDNYNSFISMNLNKFLGEWVAISENTIIAHGKDLKEVYQKAKEIKPGIRPFITKVRTTVKMIL